MIAHKLYESISFIVTNQEKTVKLIHVLMENKKKLMFPEFLTRYYYEQ